MKYKVISSGLFCFIAICVCAQEKSNIKFGKVSPEDFKTKIYSIDSNANAVIIADIGSTEIVGNTKGWFSLEYKHFRRVHILNKNGYDIADVEIPLYASTNGEEELSKLKAVTYNLENGKVVETKLDAKSGIFKDKINKNWEVKKFTFPNLKEGAIIEYEYTVTSDFLFNLQPWEFQGKYPRLWSEYEVSIPEFLNYIFLSQGYLKMDNDKKVRRTTYYVSDNSSAYASERFKLDANVNDNRWVLKNIPALKEESYTSTLENHIAKINFQLSEYRMPLTPKNVMSSWPQVCKDLLQDEDFGSQLSKDNGWLGDIVNEAIAGAQTDLDKAKNIFTYVRDHMTCTSHSGKYLQSNLRNVVKARSGNVADINLLLIAMLRKADLKADPVMLSTRGHGYTYELYPVMERFNYVVALATINGKEYYLDASEKMGFGKLSSKCYNGHARIINESARPVYLVSDSLLEFKMSSAIIVNGENGSIVGSMQQTPGYLESNSIRNVIKEKGEEQLFGDIKKAFPGEADIKKRSIDSLNKYEFPVKINYDFSLAKEGEDIIYFNPMLGEGWKENPFKSAERFYPVEMPYAIDEIFLLRMDVPTGYKVDELPKQMVLKLNEEGDGMFEYRISESNGVVSFRSRLQLKRANFLPEEYEMLREFFNLVVKKHAEQIVFKKK